MRAFRWFAIAAATLAIACGGDAPAPAQQGTRPMAPQPAGPVALNRAPAIRELRLEPEGPLDGDTVRAVVAVEDRDGDRVALRFVWWVAGQRQATGEPAIALEGVRKGESIEVEVTPSDGRSTGEALRRSVSVRNSAPVVVGVGLRPNVEVRPGEPLVATAQARDPDDDSLDYRFEWLVNGERLSTEGPELATRGLARGDAIQVVVVVTDGELESEPVESVVVRVGNAPPLIASNPNGKWEDGQFQYTIEARDPDGAGPLRYALRTGPDGMHVDPVLGNVSWSPNAGQTGTHVVEVAVSDSMGATTLQTFEVSVDPIEVATEAPPASLR